MRALTFWKAVTVDHANFLEHLLAVLNEHHIRYCVIGGQAVNAYAEPVVSLDLDLVIAREKFGQFRTRPAGPASGRRTSADIARLLETYPDLRSRVPADVLARLI